MKTLLSLLFLSYATPILASQIIAHGELEPLAGLARATGTISVVAENDGTQNLYFSENYNMSSGVILDLKLCGKVFLTDRDTACISQGEVRVLKGRYKMPVRWPLQEYHEAKIFDVDLVQNHAHANLE